MAEQMKFCRSCGKQINADAAFCRFCGFRFEAPVQAAQPQTATKFCNQCGKQINADAPFCRFCGNKFDVPTQSGAAQASTNVAATVAAVNPYVQKIASAVQMPQRLFASANAGEFTLGEGFSLGNFAANVSAGGVSFGAAQRKVREILSPAKVLGNGVKSFFGGIFGVFKNPKALISTLLLAAAWIVLPMLKNGGADNGIIDLLS